MIMLEHMIEQFVFDMLALLPAAPAILGWGAVVGFTINIVKLFVGDKMDGLAAQISLIANAVLLVVLWVTNYLGCRGAFETIVEQLGIALPAIYAILVAALGAKGAHWLMKGIDAKSFSFSAR